MNNFKVINSNTIIKDLEEENKKLKNKLKFFTYRIKVLKSKVKTYEADINNVFLINSYFYFPFY